MRWRPGVAAVLIAMGCAPLPAAAKPVLTGCDAFIEKLRLAASDMQVAFTHSLVVSRAKTEENVFDIVTNAEVDATLTCHGDVFLRFEARVIEPASARASTSFDRFAEAALRAAMGWDASRGQTTLRGMAKDVREYLAASRQRGDIYVSGKTEEHAPGGVSLGLIYTDTDRAFVIVGPNG
ncbi:MAG: hypothetical protein ABSG83_19110 [Roseiarcus sp.]|jgi:hypothetical protein